MPRYCFIDADTILYRSCLAVEKLAYKVDYGSGVEDLGRSLAYTEIVERYGKDSIVERYKILEPLPNCLHIIKLTLEKLIDMAHDLGYTEVVGFLSNEDSKQNFRHERAIFPGPKGVGYKNGRPAKPFYYLDARHYMLETQKVLKLYQVSPKIEADDALGIYATKYHDDGCIIMTQDKDLNQIPGRIVNWITGEDYLTKDLKLEHNGKKIYGGGDYWLWAQMLLGDACDNIPNVPRHGDRTVYKLLSGLEESALFPKVLEIYKEVYQETYKERFLSNLDLVHILRKPLKYGLISEKYRDLI